jgi:hypothetical protein
VSPPDAGHETESDVMSVVVYVVLTVAVFAMLGGAVRLLER